jgi:hypothetical protein
VIANIAACVAAIAAVVAVWYACLTVKEARTDRHEAEQERLRRRVERVGDVLANIASLVWNDLHNPPGDSWHYGRARLRHALVGLDTRLPACASLLGLSMAREADAVLQRARDEVERELLRLEEQAAAPGKRG